MGHRWTVKTSKGPAEFRMPLPIYQARLVLAAKNSGIVEFISEDDVEAQTEAAIDPWLLMGAAIGYTWAGQQMDPNPRRMADVYEYGEAVLYWLMDEGYTQADGQEMAATAFKRIVYDSPKQQEVDARVNFSEAQKAANSSSS